MINGAVKPSRNRLTFFSPKPGQEASCSAEAEVMSVRDWKRRHYIRCMSDQKRMTYTKITRQGDCIGFVDTPDISENCIHSGQIIRFPALLYERGTFLLEGLPKEKKRKKKKKGAEFQ